MQIAINNLTGIMYTDNKVRYSLQKQRLLQVLYFEIPLPVNLMKKVFEETIISIH